MVFVSAAGDRSAAGIEAVLHSTGLIDKKLESEVEISLYRLPQEAQNNVINISKVFKEVVRLAYGHGQVIMVVSDNGKGFDPRLEPMNALMRAGASNPNSHYFLFS